uniref:Coiled-coil domain-containing protein n=1 Tax=Glossina austeni TaxID=7395 RepID=A0A1A9VL38_GLOAU
MAFYTSRVDDDGNELERRPTARSLASSKNESTTRLNLSSRSCDRKTGVLYINPAAYIEKDGEMERSHTGRAGSIDSKCPSVSEIESDIVPPLDLQSEENYPTTRDYTFSYRKHCEAAKIVLKPEKAYETWLSAKRKLLSDEAAKRKKAEQQKRQELEDRKRLSDEKLKKWLKLKASQPKTTTNLAQEPSLQQISSNLTVKSRSMNTELLERPTRPQLSKEETKARLIEWDRNKRVQEERRRAAKRQEEQKRRELQEQRRHIAAGAWERWSSDVAKKPKPVPLNRGILTLRGTISNIYTEDKVVVFLLNAKQDVVLSLFAGNVVYAIEQ